jgi:microcompartment protein CcmK/EutM
MLLARVVGTVVATRKDDRLVSNKLLVVRPVDPAGKFEGAYLVAVDTVDAGFGETVLIVSGSSARMASGLKDCPVDAAIVGIVDHVDVGEPRELVGALSAGASAKAEDASPARK